jgi:hypothetical protein
MWAVRRLVRDAAKRDNKMSAFVLGVATSPLFTMGRAAEAATTVAAVKPQAPSPKPQVP